jgi:small-conductance mechanosensitive channel
VPPEVARRRTLEICLWIIAFWLAIWLFGFSLATLLTTFFYLKVSARERWPMSVILTACACAFVYGLFEKGLGVPFPPGQLLVWLGLAG